MKEMHVIASFILTIFISSSLTVIPSQLLEIPSWANEGETLIYNLLMIDILTNEIYQGIIQYKVESLLLNETIVYRINILEGNLTEGGLLDDFLNATKILNTEIFPAVHPIHLKERKPIMWKPFILTFKSIRIGSIFNSTVTIYEYDIKIKRENTTKIIGKADIEITTGIFISIINEIGNYKFIQELKATSIIFEISKKIDPFSTLILFIIFLSLIIIAVIYSMLNLPKILKKFK